jgi:hypothetical protein
MNESRRVAEAVEDLQAKGESLNEAAFEAIGRDTAVGGKTKVKELLKERRFWSAQANRLLELGRKISTNYRR